MLIISLLRELLNLSKTNIENNENNSAQNGIQSKLEFDDSRFKNNLLPNDELEVLRTKLINEYKENSPISITNFIELITANKSFPGWHKIHQYFNTKSVVKIFEDGNFNIEPNLLTGKYSEKVIKDKKLEILKKIHKIYTENNNTITEKILLENKLSPSTIKYYFDNIHAAYELADVKPKQKKQERLTKSEVITRITDLVPIFKKDNIPFTAKELKKHGISFYFIQQYFGSLGNLLLRFNIK